LRVQTGHWGIDWAEFIEKALAPAGLGLVVFLTLWFRSRRQPGTFRAALLTGITVAVIYFVIGLVWNM
jgi:hypothetical protein